MTCSWVAEWWQCQRSERNVQSFIQWCITSSDAGHMFQWNVRRHSTTTETEPQLVNWTWSTLKQQCTLAVIMHCISARGSHNNVLVVILVCNYERIRLTDIVLTTTLCPKNAATFLLSVKNKLIWIIFGTYNPEEILHKCFWTWTPHLKNVTTVPYAADVRWLHNKHSAVQHLERWQCNICLLYTSDAADE